MVVLLCGVFTLIYSLTCRSSHFLISFFFSRRHLKSWQLLSCLIQQLPNLKTSFFHWRRSQNIACQNVHTCVRVISAYMRICMYGLVLINAYLSQALIKTLIIGRSLYATSCALFYPVNFHLSA